jgi:hypothetical protein
MKNNKVLSIQLHDDGRVEITYKMENATAEVFHPPN